MQFDYVKTIRDQLIFVATFFAVFGLIMTDSYYSYFGVKYQFLNINTTHIIYRGFTLIYFNLFFLLILLIILIGVLIGQLQSGHVFDKYDSIIKKYKLNWQFITYLILSIAFIVGGYLSFITGAATAVQDMYVESTSLRQISSFYSKSEEKTTFVTKLMAAGPILILHDTGQQIVVFQPPSLPASRPRIEVYHIGVSSDEFYSDRTPIFR